MGEPLPAGRQTLWRLRPAVWSAEAIAVRLAVAIAAVWVVLLIREFGALVRVIYANADIVSAPYIGELYPAAPNGAVVVLGVLPWYTTLWFELATRHVPFHRELWEVGPWIGSLFSIGLIAWATARAAGRWAGAFVAFVAACAGPTMLVTQFSLDLHGATVMHVCLLDAFLVLLVSRRGLIGGGAAHRWLCLGVGLLTAIGAASDNLLFPAGVVPFVAAGLVVGLLYPQAIRKRISLSVLAVGAVSVAGSRIVLAAMRSQHVYASNKTVIFTNWNDIGARFRQFLESLASLFNADFSGAAIGARSLLAFVCACLLAAGLIMGIRATRGWYQELGVRLASKVDEDLEQFALRGLQLTFWSLGILLPALAFILLNFGKDLVGRYFVSAAYGVVVMIAVTFARRPFPQRAAAVLGASLVVAGSIVAIASRDLQSNPGHFPQQPFANFLKTFADGEGLKVGYAAYWVAAPLGWEMGTGVQVYPVLSCAAPRGLCTYPQHAISSWYTPRPSTRTFLVTDPRYGPTPPGMTLGGPDEVVSFGGYQIYVYDYDIASNLGDWHSYQVPE